MESNSSPSSGDVIITPETGHVRITPLGFWLRGRDFLDASVLLSQNSGRFSFVATFLACRAVELALKAYLLARGDSLTQVKQLGHNLTAALVESYSRGIDMVVALDPAERELLQRVNGDYVGHNFAYFDVWSAVSAPKDPALDELPAIARRLLDGIEKGCYEATEGNWNPIANSSQTAP
jgi:HEPN domain-containing protein